MYNFAAHINDRLVFRDFMPLTKATNSKKSLLDVCTLKVGLSIGDDNRRDGGLSGSFKLIKVDNPSQMFKQLKLSPDSGSALLIDLLYREKTPSKDMDRCVTLLRQFLVMHIERELRGNRMFSGMTVCNAINEQDNSKVLRVIFCYKRMVSLDGWLEQMLIPYTVADLIPILMGDFRTNLDFADIIKSKLTTLSSHFSGSVSCCITKNNNDSGDGGSGDDDDDDDDDDDSSSDHNYDDHSSISIDLQYDTLLQVDCSIGFKRNTLMALLEVRNTTAHR